MTSRVATILDLIDTALADPGQHSPESDQYFDVAPAMPPAGTCWRCTTTPAADGSELCAGCRSYLLEDTDHDPCGITVVTAPEGYLFAGQGRPAGPEMPWTQRPIIITARSNVYARFAEACRHGQPQQLRLSALGDRVIGFLGDRLIRARTVLVESTNHTPPWTPWSTRSPSELLIDTHITIDGHRFLAQSDSAGIQVSYTQRECGDRTFWRLTAIVTPDGWSGPAIDIVGQEHVTLRGPGVPLPSDLAPSDYITMTATWGDPADLARLDFEEALQRLHDALNAPLDILRSVLHDMVDKIGLSPHAAADSLIRVSRPFVEPPPESTPADPPPPGPRNRAERRADRSGRTITTNAGPRPAWTHRVAR